MTESRTATTEVAAARVLPTTGRLLTVTAIIELGAALALLTFPSATATLLLGSPLDAPIALTVARVAGVALLALTVACGLARAGEQSVAGRGLIGGLIVYNVGVAAILTVSGLGRAPHGIALWPAVVLHLAMGAWCVARLRQRCPP